jgi:hypothetical protein
MPVPVTQPSLVQRIRTATRQPNANGFISDAEIIELVREGAYLLYNLLVAARGAHYYLTEWGTNTVPGGKRIVLPQNFYRLVSVMISETPGINSGLTQPQDAIWFEIPRMHPQDWAEQESLKGQYLRDLRYAIEGEQHNGNPTQLAHLALYPAPRSVWNLRVLYLPTLDLSTDTVSGFPLYDGVNGFESYIVAHAAETICAMQEDSTAAFWGNKKAVIEAQIRGLASDRDGAQPMVVRDARWGGARRRYPRA